MAFKMDLGALKKGGSKLTKKDTGAFSDIQASTFTSWLNMQLRTANPKHSNIKPAQLGPSLRNGVNLIEMLQVITEKPISKWKPTPRGKMQEIENLNIAFEFMAAEGVKLENIGSLDIWDGTKQLILGLLWTIIYNFQIVRGIGDSKGMSAKTELLMWLQAKIPEFGIKNLVDDWRDGRALAALVNAIGKDFMLGTLVGGAELMKPEKATDNLEKAMDAAETRICVGRILTSKQMQDPACGEKSMMTYLSLFTKAKEPEKEATPLQKKALFSPPKAAPPAKPKVEDEVDPVLLSKIQHLFTAMDADGNGGVSKFELIDFVQLHKPVNNTVAEVTSILSLDKQHEISKADFIGCFLAGKLDVDGFPLIKEHLPIHVPTSNATSLKSELKKTPQKVVTKGFDPARAKSTEPPMERDPDWREYEGHNLGGRCRIKVFFSTTTSSAKIRGNTEAMKALLERKKYHLRPDFEHFVPVDMDMEKDFRDKIFEKAGTRTTPMLFVDDEFVGGYDKCNELDELGELDLIFAY